MDSPSALAGQLLTGVAVASLLIAMLVASQAFTVASMSPPAAKPQPYERMR